MLLKLTISMALGSSQSKLYYHHFTRLREVRSSDQHSTGMKWLRFQVLPGPLGPLPCARGHSADWMALPHQGRRAGRIRKGWGSLSCQVDDQGPSTTPILEPAWLWLDIPVRSVLSTPPEFSCFLDILRAPSWCIVGLCGSELTAHLNFFHQFLF